MDRRAWPILGVITIQLTPISGEIKRSGQLNVPCAVSVRREACPRFARLSSIKRPLPTPPLLLSHPQLRHAFQYYYFI